jgi:hypothetical protein
MTLTEKDIETLSPEQRERRDALMKRVLTKEQADRAVGIDEETIASTRKLREIEVKLIFINIVSYHNVYYNLLL